MTIKSKSALDTQLTTNLANNSTGSITPALLRQVVQDLQDTVLGVYGAISVAGGSAAQGLTTSYAKLTGFAANGLSSGMTPDHTNDQITVLTAGDVEVEINLQGSGSGAGTFTFAPGLNGTESSVYQGAHTCTGTETWSVKVLALITCAANDIITVRGKASASLNFTPANAQLVVRRVS